MRSTLLTSVSLVLLSAFIFSSCSKDQCSTTYTYKVYEPEYLDYDELRSAVASEAPRSLENPGKIYLYGAYLYVNELDKGVHVIDNSNPSNPVTVAFINIPGNVDIAVHNAVLYADSYIDLVAIDVSDPMNVTETKRLEDIFPQRLDGNGLSYDPQKGVVVDWIETDKTETIDVECGTNYQYYGNPYWEGDAIFLGPAFTGAQSATATVRNAIGIGGSMARFAVSGRYLYAIDNSDMTLLDITDYRRPVIWNKISIGFNIETIFPYDHKLFIGSQTGMHIYDNSNPSSPQHISSYSHIRSCDPVVVEDDYAFVTLRSGTPCQGFTNQLDVVDISNLSSPSLHKSYDMFNPHGLGINNGTLFICDGDAGLKVFDASDVNTIDQNLLGHFGEINAYDVIPYGNILIMIGEDGLYQYDYSNPQNVQLVSQIPVI